MSRHMTGVLALVVLVAAGMAAHCDGARAAVLQRAPLSAVFKEWRDQAAGLRPSASGLSDGLVPAPVGPGELSAGGADEERAVTKAGAASLPSEFDLRDEGDVTAIRDQGDFGTCWTFATLASLESALLLSGHEAADFSEDNLARVAGFDLDPYEDGGNALMSTAYLARWAGPVLESEDAYGDYVTPSGLNASRHVQNVIYLPERASAIDNVAIKAAIMEEGAVYTSFYWASGNYGSSNASYYCPSDPGSVNHAVAIVGWDDHYDVSNFRASPAGDGAFIVRNSWGAGWGAAGYFYVSYHDATFARGAGWSIGGTAVFTSEGNVNYDASYEYDPLGLVYAYGTDASDRDTAWMANRFTARSDGSVSAVSFYTLGEGSRYEVYVDSTLTPDSADLVASGSLKNAGYHTVSLVMRPALTSGAQFYVMVRLETPGSDYPLALEGVAAGYSSSASASTGQSYVADDASAAAGAWQDVGGTSDELNVCLKAFAVGAPVTTAIGLEPDRSSGWVRGIGEVMLSARGGAGAIMTHYRLDGGKWRIYSGAFSVYGDGSHRVQYYSSDSVGTTETIRAGYVNIDTVRPSSRARARTLKRTRAKKGRRVPVRVTLKDAVPSCGRVRLVTTISTKSGHRLGRTTIGSAAVNRTRTVSVKLTKTLKRGTYFVLTRATDKAGNTQARTGRVKLTVRG